MRSKLNRFIPFLLSGLLFFVPLSGQMMIDGIIAVVGEYTIMQSDIEQQLLQYQGTGLSKDELRCRIVEQYIQDKLLLDQAKIDSIEVTESTVEGELDRRLQYFTRQFGSREELEAYFHKTILEIKEDFRDDIRNHLIAQRMQHELTDKIRITPSEVKEFYNNMHKDSIPLIDAQVEIAQIVVFPPLGEQAIFTVREKLLELRKRIMDGENFGTLAILYSEDASAANEGEIGYTSQAELDPEYAKAAFGLKAGQVSKIVESQFGFHIIQLIDRRDDRVNTRHILIKPQISAESKRNAISRLDSILVLIRSDSMTFEQAAIRFSEDKKSRLNNGLVLNRNSNSSFFGLDELEIKDNLLIRDMKVGEISNPYESKDENNKTIYKIIKLKSRSDPHRANLKQDYVLLQNISLAEKKNRIITKWIEDKQLDTFIHVDSRYANCNFIKTGWGKSISF